MCHFHADSLDQDKDTGGSPDGFIDPPFPSDSDLDLEVQVRPRAPTASSGRPAAANVNHAPTGTTAGRRFSGNETVEVFLLSYCIIIDMNMIQPVTIKRKVRTRSHTSNVPLSWQITTTSWLNKHLCARAAPVILALGL